MFYLHIHQIAELRSRGWSKFELAGLLGANFLRVFGGAERVARSLQASGALPIVDLYERRSDLPVRDLRMVDRRCFAS
jgi:membrane dipeptidase